MLARRFKDAWDESVPTLESAVEDFRSARRRARFQAFKARLAGRRPELLSYKEVRAKLKGRESSKRVLADIPLSAIVGSVNRHWEFTHGFLPGASIRESRWAGIKLAMIGFKGLPPIEVYRISETYFVIDGNHRVSVAREMGLRYIEAYVTEVITRIPMDNRPTSLENCSPQWP